MFFLDFRPVLERLDRIVDLLTAIRDAVTHGAVDANRTGRMIMADLTDLEDAIGAQTDVVQGVSTLLDELATRLENAADDPAAVAALAAEVRTNSSSLAAAVARDTPADPGAGTPPGESGGTPPSDPTTDTPVA